MYKTDTEPHDQAVLETQLHVSEILLYELGTNEEMSAGLAQIQRFELLWKCAKATRAMLEARFRKVDGQRRRFIGIATFDYAYAMIVCLRLSNLSLPGWDLALARRELNFDRYLVLQIEELREFTAQRSQSPGPDDGMQPFQDPYVCLHDKLVKIRASVVAEMAATMLPVSSHGPCEAMDAAGAGGTAHRDRSETTDAIATENIEGGFSDSLSGFDDAFWQDLYRDTEWETNMSALLAWGSDDTTEPSHDDWTTDTL